MKKHVSTLLVLCCVSLGFEPSALKAQLVFEPDSKKVVCNAQVNEYTAFDIYITNTSNEPLALEWKTLARQIDDGWDYSVCDYGHCYGGIPDRGVMDTLPAKTKGFMALNLTASKSSLPGMVKIYVNKIGSPTEGDTLLWNFSTAQSSVKNGSTSSVVNISPSVATNILRCTTPEGVTIRSLNIYSADGRKVIEVSPHTSTEYQVDISRCAAGVYFVRILTNDGIMTPRKFEKIQ